MQGEARLRGLADYLLKDHQGRIAPAPPVRAQRCCAPLVCAPCRRAIGYPGLSPPVRTGGLFTQRPSGAHRPRAPCTGAALLRPLVCASCCRADKIEHEIRYAPLAVGLSAIQGGARLRGLLWIISSKTTYGLDEGETPVHRAHRFLRARRPRSQARSHAALPAGKMPTLPGVLPRGAACGQDAHTPRRAPTRRCLRARCPHSQATLPAGKMPALPGVLPGDAACGQDAHTPRRAPTRRCLRARRPRSQATLPAGKMPTLPGVLPRGAACGQDTHTPRRAPRRRCTRARRPCSQN